MKKPAPLLLEEEIEVAAGVPANLICPNCGTPIQGGYCHYCGQKQRTPHDYRLLHFILHAFHEFTDLDSQVLRSLRYLLFSPGKLTVKWRSGHENSYIKPMRLFLITNVFYFLFLEVFPVQTIVVPLDSQYSQQGYSRFIRPMIDNRIHTAHVPYKRFAEVYDTISVTQAKTLVILMVPMFATLLAILYFRRKRYMVEHLVFSLHFYAFFLLLISVGTWAINEIVIEYFRLFSLNINDYLINWDILITFADGALIFLYLMVAVRRVYNGNRLLNIVRAGLLCYGILFVLFCYRLVLFFTTIYSMPSKL